MRVTHKTFPVHNIHAYQCTYEFQRTGRQVPDFLCNKQYITITANRSQYLPHDNKYVPRNVDSSSTDSIYGTLQSKTNYCSTPPYPKHRTTLLQPDQTELAYIHATHRRTSLKSTEERGGSTLTWLLQLLTIMLRSRIPFAGYSIINVRKAKK